MTDLATTLTPSVSDLPGWCAAARVDLKRHGTLVEVRAPDGRRLQEWLPADDAEHEIGDFASAELDAVIRVGKQLGMGPTDGIQLSAELEISTLLVEGLNDLDAGIHHSEAARIAQALMADFERVATERRR